MKGFWGKAGVWLWLAISVFPHLVWAGEQATELGEIVVTATRTEIPVSQAPAAVTVITRKEMEKKRIVTVDDALKHEAGVFVYRRKGLMDAVTSVTLRGVPYQKRTLIMLDGIPLNDGYASEIKWATLSTDQVQRIEIVRGPYSSLWGGNAIGGAINIITRLPEKFTFWSKGGFGNGEEVTHSYRIGLGHRIGRFAFLSGYEKDETGGYPTVPAYKDEKYFYSGTGTLTGGYAMTDPTGTKLRWIIGDKGDNWAKRENYFLTAGLNFRQKGQLKLDLQHGWFTYGYGPPHTYLKDANGQPAFSGKVSLPDGRYASVKPYNFVYYAGLGGDEIDLVAIKYRDYLGKSEIETSLAFWERDGYWTKPDYTTTYNSGPGEVSETDTKTYYFDFKTTIPIFERNILTSGLTFRHDQADENTYDISFYRDPESKVSKTYLAKGETNSLGLFVQNKVELKENFGLYLGLRYDHWWAYNGESGNIGSVEAHPSRDDGTFSPKASLVWRPDNSTTLRVSFGKAFRPPNIYELYRTWSSGSTIYHSNPSLDPEKAYSLEGGLEKWINKKAKVNFTLFQTWLRDLIYRRSEEVNGHTEKFWVNAGKGEIFGIEGGILLKPFSWLTTSINYTRNDTKIVENEADPSSEGKRFTNVPPWIWNFNITVRQRLFMASLFGHYVGKVFHKEDNSDIAEGVYGTSERYFIADFKGTIYLPSFKIAQNEVKTEVSLSVNNLFDEKYWDYYRAPGRNWFLALELHF